MNSLEQTELSRRSKVSLCFLVFCRKYPEIKTYEQRCSYKENFAKEYTEFTATKERLDLVTKQFNDLKEKLKNYPADSHAAKVNIL